MQVQKVKFYFRSFNFEWSYQNKILLHGRTYKNWYVVVIDKNNFPLGKYIVTAFVPSVKWCNTLIKKHKKPLSKKHIKQISSNLL